jgi:transcriptional regulator with XRE-family HTH domain
MDQVAVVSDAEAKVNVAENVSRLIQQLGISQGELARRSGESKMRISLVRRGMHLPSAGFLARLAEALGVSADFLLNDPTENFPKKSRRTA